uniref:Uncharacterized protein n=1 Tax=Steinernema glaseri TaxID=37863 RepID=A0A1I7ZRH4_9BILA
MNAPKWHSVRFEPETRPLNAYINSSSSRTSEQLPHLENIHQKLLEVSDNADRLGSSLNFRVSEILHRNYTTTTSAHNL